MATRKTNESNESIKKTTVRSPRSKKKTETSKKDEPINTSTKEPVSVEETSSEPKPVEMSVSEYFDYVKNVKQETNSEEVKKMADVCMNLLKKFEMLGQVEAAKKAKNAFDVMTKDLKLFEKGITTYVHIDDVTKYLKDIAGHNVKLIELENFPREIPDEVCDRWLEVKDLFDGAFVVFTDYTENTEETDTAAAAQGKTSTAKEVEKKRKEKDPILFGVIKVNSASSSLRGNTYEKMYYIADWIDDYCDLTFDKLVAEMAKKLDKNESDIAQKVGPAVDKEDFKKRAGL